MQDRGIGKMKTVITGSDGGRLVRQFVGFKSFEVCDLEISDELSVCLEFARVF